MIFIKKNAKPIVISILLLALVWIIFRNFYTEDRVLILPDGNVIENPRIQDFNVVRITELGYEISYGISESIDKNAFAVPIIDNEYLDFSDKNIEEVYSQKQNLRFIDFYISDNINNVDSLIQGSYLANQPTYFKMLKKKITNSKCSYYFGNDLVIELRAKNDTSSVFRIFTVSASDLSTAGASINDR